MYNAIFFLFVFVLSFGLTYIIRKIAIKKAIMDIPNDRSSHTIPTPRGGGLAVAISWFAGVSFLFATHQIESSLFFALLAGLPLTIIGFLDDVLNLKPAIRMLVQLCCAAAGLYFLGGFHTINLGTYSTSNVYIYTPIAFVAIVWFINLFNFLDGIDGYISTELIFIGLAIFAFTGNVIGLLMVVSTLGFLLWNWQKAKIFMGDVGSTLLGFNVAILAIYFNEKQTLNIWCMLILTAIFWFDATLTLVRRFLNKENLSQAHRKHAYQRIVQYGFSHQKTVVYALAINIIGAGVAYLIFVYPTWSIIATAFYTAFLYFIVKQIDKVKAFE